MKKIRQLGTFLCDDETNLPIRGRLFSEYGCSPTIYNFANGGAGIKDCAMEVRILVNGSPEKSGMVCRAIRASYGKCGFMSLWLRTGQGITGVLEYNDEEL